MQFRTLLPPKGSANGHRQERLVDDYHLFQVRARVLVTEAGDELLRLMVWINNLGWAELLLSDLGDIVALALDAADKDAWKAAEAVAELKGYEVVPEEFRTLFSPKWSQNGSRRSARLFDGKREEDATFQVSAKVITSTDSEDEFLQVRVWIGSFGWAEVVLNDVGDIVAHTVGSTEKDAWKAAQAVMRRKGYVA
jgi:hypothetical protein